MSFQARSKAGENWYRFREESKCIGDPERGKLDSIVL